MSRLSPLGTKRSELLNIQKRDWPCFGPSFTNSWPSPFPHFPQRTYMTTYFKFMFESKPMPHMNIHSDCNVCLGYKETNAAYLEGARPLLLLGEAIFVNGFSECWPWWRMLVFGPTWEKLMATLRTHIDAWWKIHKDSVGQHKNSHQMTKFLSILNIPIKLCLYA